MQSDASGSPCSSGKQCYGGAARRATEVKRIRDQKEHVLFLDAGDQSQGTPWYVVYEGDAAAHFMKSLHYDAMAMGNHEFDNGVDSFVDHFMHNLTNPETNETEFPVLAANIDASKEPRLNGLFNDTAIFEETVPGVKIGVVGYITEETVDISGECRFKCIFKAYLIQIRAI